MPSPVNLIRAFLTQAQASGEVSTALQPLLSLAYGLLAAIGLAAWLSAPAWVHVLFGALLATDVAAYLWFYRFFALKNPDYLRSEKFTLQKMALEKNLVGDSASGLIEVKDASHDRPRTALPPPDDAP